MSGKKNRLRYRKRRLFFEDLEARQMMSVVVCDQDLKGYQAYTYFHHSTLPIKGLLPSDLVTAQVSLSAGDQPPGPTIMEASLGGQKVKMERQGTKTIQFRTDHNNETLDVKIFNYDSDDRAHVKVYYDRQDLEVVAPYLGGDRLLHYGAKVCSNIAVDPQGKFVGVELVYAKQSGLEFIPLKTIVSARDLRLETGGQTDYSISLDSLPTPPVSATHIVAWVDRGRVITEQSYDNNCSAIAIDSVLPNFIVREPKRTDNGGIEYGYEIQALPRIPSAVSVDLYYAEGTTRNDLLVQLDHHDLSYKAWTGKTFSWSSGKLAVPPPVGATHVIAVVDVLDHVAESKESDNLVAVPLSKLFPNYTPSGHRWDTDGDLHIQYQTTGAATPQDLNPRWGVFWAKGTKLKDLLSDLPLAKTEPIVKGKLQKTAGDWDVMIPFAKLQPPAGATHLLFVTDYLKVSDETNESDNVRAIRVTPLLSISGGLTAYRPQSEGLEATKVPDETEDTTGAGIRINGDDDDQNGIPDNIYQGAFRGTNEDDLIRLDIRVNLPASDRVEYILRRTDSSLKIWSSSIYGDPILVSDQSPVALISGNQKQRTVWVEWSGTEHGRGQIQLLARDKDTGKEKLLDKVRFTTYRSQVVIFTGEKLGSLPKSTSGMSYYAKTLYNQGYDVQFWIPTDIDEAVEEACNAIAFRQVTDLAVLGHSHGGGAVYGLTARLADMPTLLSKYHIVFTAYIDAIQNTLVSPNIFDAETRYPIGSECHVNYYQKKTPLLKDCTVPGAKVNVNVSNKEWGKKLGHFSITDAKEVREAILKRVANRVVMYGGGRSQ